jgi:hypothetical protein
MAIVNNGIVTFNTVNNHQADSPSFSLPRLLDSYYIKNKVDQIRRDDDLANDTNLKMSDRRRSNILDIAEFLEAEMLKAGQDLLIQEISRIITRVFEMAGLDRHCYLILEVLPDRHKDPSRNQYKNLQSGLAANRIKRHVGEIRAIDRKLLDADTLRELRDLVLEIPYEYDDELRVRDEPLVVNQASNPANGSQLDSLKRMERDRFQTARLGAPLSTPDQLCQADHTYAYEFEGLKKTLQQSIRGHQIIYKWFVEDYPPLTTAHVIKLNNAFRVWNELMRPYFDRKYRRDHMQSIKTAYMRVLHTSTKASHESGIPCAHHLDRNGMPVMRCMTKEQIDSMYPWEVNFIQKLLNTFFYFVEDITEVNEAHGQRNLEDRAIDLSSTLSHQA